ncbi:MAG: PEGA domain-containing protein [Gemmatimonadota bacterium]
MTHLIRRAAAPVAIIALVPFLVAACGTIMNGTTQEIGVASVPTGATVTLNGMQRGSTPLVLDLKRKNQQVISVALDGYEPYEVALTRSVSGWVWGNLVFGGLIGLAVDASTGGLYKLSPEQVAAELRKSGAAVDVIEDLLVMRVVLQPEPGWERIGALERE